MNIAHLKLISVVAFLAATILAPALFEMSSLGMSSFFEMSGILLCASAEEAWKLPALDDRVNDFANMLLTYEKIDLERFLARTRSNSKIEMKVIALESLAPYKTRANYGAADNIESFARQVMRMTPLGEELNGRSVLFVISKGDRLTRIELGRAFPASERGRMASVLENTVLGNFRRSKYSAGVVDGTHAIVAKLTAGYFSRMISDFIDAFLPFVGIALMLVFFVLQAMFGRRGGYRRTSYGRSYSSSSYRSSGCSRGSTSVSGHGATGRW